MGAVVVGAGVVPAQEALLVGALVSVVDGSIGRMPHWCMCMSLCVRARVHACVFMCLC